MKDVHFANKVVREVRCTATLPMHIYRCAAPVVVAWADASEATDADGKAIGGYLVTMTEEAALKGYERRFSLLSWCCKRLPRVARSSEAAEAQACAEALDELDWCRLVWHEMTTGTVNLTTPEESYSSSSTVVTETFTFVLTMKLLHGPKVTRSRKRLRHANLLA